MATASLSVQNWYETTLTSGISSTDTTIALNVVPTPSEGYLVIEPDSSTNREVIYYTSKTGSGVVLPSVGAGRGVDGTTGISHSSGATVRMQITKGHFDSIQDGSFFTDNVINPVKLKTASHWLFDFVASGCVWSGDAYGSTRAASMTSGVVYIGGKYVAVSSVSARTFTASKDTYIDVDNTGTLTYTEVTNNAASPALSANNIRLGIIVTGAGNIANAGSVNQGEESKVLPIASSIPYAVTDSLGNLICPRDPNRKILGYRQSTASFTTSSTSQTQVTGLSVPVIVPTSRKIKITAYAEQFGQTTASTNVAVSKIWDGTVGSGTALNQVNSVSNSGTANLAPVTQEVITTPSAASKTYNVGLNVNVSGTATYSPINGTAFIRVELV